MQKVIVDAMIVSNQEVISSLHEICIKNNLDLCTAPAVDKELKRGAISCPDFIKVISLEEGDNTQIKKLLRRASTGKKDTVTLWKKGRLVPQQGEIECMVIAKRVSGLFITNDSGARRLAGRVVGWDNVFSTDDFIRHFKVINDSTE